VPPGAAQPGRPHARVAGRAQREIGQQRDAEAGGHQGLGRDEIVGGERDPRGEAGRRALLQQVLTTAVAPGDPPVLRQPGQVGGPQFGHRGRQRRLAAAHRRVGHDQVHRLGQQYLLADVVTVRCRYRVVVRPGPDRLVLVARLVPRARLVLTCRRGFPRPVPRTQPPAVGALVPEDQRHVDVPGAQHPHRLRWLRLGQPQVHARMPLMHDRSGGRHDRAERRGESGQPQPPGPQPGEDRELVLRGVEAADHLDGPLGE